MVRKGGRGRHRAVRRACVRDGARARVPDAGFSKVTHLLTLPLLALFGHHRRALARNDGAVRAGVADRHNRLQLLGIDDAAVQERRPEVVHNDVNPVLQARRARDVQARWRSVAVASVTHPPSLRPGLASPRPRPRSRGSNLSRRASSSVSASPPPVVRWTTPDRSMRFVSHASLSRLYCSWRSDTRLANDDEPEAPPAAPPGPPALGSMSGSSRSAVSSYHSRSRRRCSSSYVARSASATSGSAGASPSSTGGGALESKPLADADGGALRPWTLAATSCGPGRQAATASGISGQSG